MRLDTYLYKNGLAKSRTYAAELIKNNLVQINSRIISKASFIVSENDNVQVVSELYDYVSRAAIKLKTAVESFKIDLKNKVVVDIGSSTGGFTDYCLKNNAKKVYAIDVGTNQLVDTLKNDSRVISLENCDIRSVDNNIFKENIQFICCDVSFISVIKIIGKISELATDSCDIIILVKPQFEVGAKFLNKNGVVKDKKSVINCVSNIYNIVSSLGFSIIDFKASDILGKGGNQEYLLYIRREKKTSLNFASLIKRI